MIDTTDYEALRERLARLACSLRGLNPDHVAEGRTKPAWQADDIMKDVGRTIELLQGRG